MVSEKISTAFRQYKWLYFAVAAVSGLLLSAATFSFSAVVQIVTLFAIILVLTVMLSGSVKSANSYFLLGITFFGTWILPTTYWYYSFMNPFVAVAASVGFTLLIANLFYIFRLRSKLPDHIVALALCTIWALFTFLRLRLPVTEDWWIPHLVYAIWRNPAILQLGRFGGEAAIEFVLLAFASLCALLLIRRKWLMAIVIFIAAITAVLVFNGVLSHVSTSDLPVIITVQSSTMQQNQNAAPEDIKKVKEQTETAISSLGDTHGKDIYVVWPENRIPPDNREELSVFARNNGINLVYHTYEPIVSADAPYKLIVWIGPNGEKILDNSKAHIAPGEQGTPRRSSNIIDGKTAYICYDVHYPDIVLRMRGANLVFVALNDEEFFDLEKTFHLADMALRATQANVWIAAASKDGPSAIINPGGYVERALPYHQDNVIVYNSGG